MRLTNSGQGSGFVPAIQTNAETLKEVVSAGESRYVGTTTAARAVGNKKPQSMLRTMAALVGLGIPLAVPVAAAPGAPLTDGTYIASPADSTRGAAPLPRLEAKNFPSEVLESADPVVVYFTSDWSGIDEMTMPVFETFASGLQQDGKIFEYNLSDNPEAEAADRYTIPSRYGIGRLPTAVVFNAGTPGDRMVGIHTQEQTKEFLTSAFAADQATPNAAAVVDAAKTEATAVSPKVLSKMSRANGLLALGLVEALKDAGPNPIVASVLTLKQFAQLMPTFDESAQSDIKARLGWDGLTNAEIAAGAKTYADQLTEGLPDGVIVGLADALIGAADRTINPELQNNVRIAGGSIEQKDFANPNTVDFVNNFVSVATDGKIEKIVEAGAFNRDTDFALVSAVNVDAMWRFAFPGGYETYAAKFTADGGEEVSVKMMQSEDNEYRASSGSDYEAVEVPNGPDGDFSTVYIKPKNGDLIDWMKRLEDDGALEGILESLRAQQPKMGAIRIPKTDLGFTPEPDAFLQALQANGLPNQARITTDDQPTRLNGAAYGAVATVSEDKISAAAAQTLFGTRGLPPPPREPENVLFDGSRSLLQVIVKGDEILFMNPIRNPKDE